MQYRILTAGPDRFKVQRRTWPWFEWQDLSEDGDPDSIEMCEYENLPDAREARAHFEEQDRKADVEWTVVEETGPAAGQPGQERQG